MKCTINRANLTLLLKAGVHASSDVLCGAHEWNFSVCRLLKFSISKAAEYVDRNLTPAQLALQIDTRWLGKSCVIVCQVIDGSRTAYVYVARAVTAFTASASAPTAASCTISCCAAKGGERRRELDTVPSEQLRQSCRDSGHCQRFFGQQCNIHPQHIIHT